MIAPTADALVIGAGVSGLTTAVCLAEAGVRVRVLTASASQATTSAAAGAMWGPYLVEPKDKVREWSARTLALFRTLASTQGTGIRLVSGVEASRTPTDSPDWTDLLPDFRRCDASELPAGFVSGWRATVPLIDMPAYLTYLTARLGRAGGGISQRRVDSLDECFDEAPVVVNCTGLDAGRLVPDPTVTPIRGQLVVVRNPGIEEFFTEDTGHSPELLHIYPHGDHVVLGGTAQAGRTDMQPDPLTARRIIERCADIDPRLRDAAVIGHRVGLRPSRPAVRVTEEPKTRGRRLFHNYGHGGAGVSLSWGCALEIRNDVSRSYGANPPQR